jgi:hypothetical protein
MIDCLKERRFFGKRQSFERKAAMNFWVMRSLIVAEYQGIARLPSD